MLRCDTHCIPCCSIPSCYIQEATITELNSKLNASLLANAVYLARLQPVINDVASDLNHAAHVALPDYLAATHDLQQAVEDYYSEHLHSDAAQHVLQASKVCKHVQQRLLGCAHSSHVHGTFTGPLQAPRAHSSTAQTDAGRSAPIMLCFCHRPAATHCRTGMNAQMHSHFRTIHTAHRRSHTFLSVCKQQAYLANTRARVQHLKRTLAGQLPSPDTDTTFASDAQAIADETKLINKVGRMRGWSCKQLFTGVHAWGNLGNAYSSSPAHDPLCKSK